MCINVFLDSVGSAKSPKSMPIFRGSTDFIAGLVLAVERHVAIVEMI